MTYLTKLLSIAISGYLALYAASQAQAETNVAVDGALPSYTKVSGISGNLNSIGSDTLNNLITYWAEKFNAYYPGVKVQVEGKGSGTAPPALIEGTAQFGPMSREMKSSEIDAFEKKFHYKPTAFKVAVDALAVFVNKDNPLPGLSLEQVDAAFSSSRKRGYPTEVNTWAALGLSGDWARKPISLYGRNSASGTYGFFKESVLQNGDFKNTVKEQPGSASVVQGVGVDQFSLGYSGIGYKTSGVRALPLALAKGENFVEPSQANAYSGEYPLSRFLYIYINKTPGKPLDPMIAEFIKLVLSKEGQEIVIKDGFFPISSELSKEELAKLQ